MRAMILGLAIVVVGCGDPGAEFKERQAADLKTKVDAATFLGGHAFSDGHLVIDNQTLVFKGPCGSRDFGWKVRNNRDALEAAHFARVVCDPPLADGQRQLVVTGLGRRGPLHMSKRAGGDSEEFDIEE